MVRGAAVSELPGGEESEQLDVGYAARSREAGIAGPSESEERRK